MSIYLIDLRMRTIIGEKVTRGTLRSETSLYTIKNQPKLCIYMHTLNTYHSDVLAPLQPYFFETMSKQSFHLQGSSQKKVNLKRRSIVISTVDSLYSQRKRKIKPAFVIILMLNMKFRNYQRPKVNLPFPFI